MWAWAFTSADDIYSTCFDVTVAKNKTERDRILQVNKLIIFLFLNIFLNTKLIYFY